MLSRNHSGINWFLGGVGAGLLYNLLGVVIITAAAEGTVPEHIQHDVVAEAYLKGYMNKSAGKNRINSFCGSLAGTVVIAIIAFYLFPLD